MSLGTPVAPDVTDKVAVELLVAAGQDVEVNGKVLNIVRCCVGAKQDARWAAGRADTEAEAGAAPTRLRQPSSGCSSTPSGDEEEQVDPLPSEQTVFFFHGFGGQAAQWAKQILFFNGRLNIVAPDLTGHGRSRASTNPEDYTRAALVADLQTIFDRYRTRHNVVVAHSYGVSMTLALREALADDAAVLGFIFIGPTLAGPRTTPPAFVQWAPALLLDCLRRLHRWGGTQSKSVQAMVHPDASEAVREQVLAFNQSLSSSVVKMMSAGLQMATLEDYRAVAQPCLLVVGQADSITLPEDTMNVYKVLPRPHGPHVIANAGHAVMTETPELLNALMLAFLIKKCRFKSLRVRAAASDAKIDTTKSKWALKNHAKWKATPNFSDVIGARPGWGGFVACKVMRQDDSSHSPEAFLRACGNVGLIVDISKDAPPYLTTDAAIGHRYVKVSTVSKVTPTAEDVQRFCAAVDQVWGADSPGSHPANVAVHCHYGYNRTGFLICSYLVEHRGFSPEDALAAFARARPPGIKHAHFHEELVQRASSPAAGSSASGSDDGDP